MSQRYSSYTLFLGLLLAIALLAFAMAGWQGYRHFRQERVAVKVVNSALTFRVVQQPDGGRSLGSAITAQFQPADDSTPSFAWTLDTSSFGFAEPAVDLLEEFAPGTNQDIPAGLAQNRQLRPVDLIAEPLLDSAVSWFFRGLMAGIPALTLWRHHQRQFSASLVLLLLGWPLLLYTLQNALDWAWDIAGQVPVATQRIQPENHFDPAVDHARIRFEPGARELLQGRNYQLYAYQVQGRQHHYATIGLEGADADLFFANPANPWELLRKRTSWVDWAIDSLAEMSTGIALLILGRILRKVN